MVAFGQLDNFHQLEPHRYSPRIQTAAHKPSHFRGAGWPRQRRHARAEHLGCATQAPSPAALATAAAGRRLGLARTV